MNKLHISVFRNIGLDDFGKSIMAPAMPALATYSLEINHKIQQSKPFPEYSSFIVVKADVECLIGIGNGTPTPNNFMSDGERLSFGVQAGHSITVIEYELKD